MEVEVDMQPRRVQPKHQSDRIKMLMMQAILDRVHATKPVDPIWLEIVSKPTPTTPNRLIEIQKPQQRVQENFTMEICSHRDNNMTLTPLACALLFERKDVIKTFFPTMRHQERKIIEKFHDKKSKYDHSTRLTVWSVLERLSIWDWIWKSLRRSGPTPEALDILCFVLTMTADIPRFRSVCQRLMNQVYATVADKPGASLFVFERCTTIVEANLKRRDSFAYVTPLPNILSHGIALWPVDRMISPAPHMAQRIYTQLIENPNHPEFERWAKLHYARILDFMDHKIRPYITSLLPHRHAAKPFGERLDSGYAFLVHRSQCAYEFFGNYCLVKWNYIDPDNNESKSPNGKKTKITKSTKLQFVLRRDEYDSYQGSHWFIIRHGCVTTKNTNPWIRQHIAKFKGHVPRLRFGLTRSDGMIFLGEGKADPTLYGLQEKEIIDITGILGLCKKVIHRSKPKNPIKSSSVPFPTVAVLSREQLMRIAPMFASWTPTQRQLFYVMFWNLNARMTYDYNTMLPGVKEFWVAALNDVWNWTGKDVQRDELLQWINIPTEDNEKARENLNLFWNRWRVWTSHLSLPVQALYSLQNGISPLAVLTAWIPQSDATMAQHEETFIGRVCQLAYRLEAIWRPSSMILPPEITRVSAIHSFIRMILAPEFPSEIKRVAWHSVYNMMFFENDEDRSRIQRGHLLFPSTSYPLISSSEAKNMPRSFIRLSNDALVPDRPILLMFSRLTGLSMHPDQLEHIQAQLLSQPSLSTYANQIELVFAEEKGRGPSVNNEVLRMMWSSAIQKGLLRVIEVDQAVCISPGHTGSDEERRRLFELGLISAICICKGLYLPYPLHIGWWRYLTTRSENNGSSMYDDGYVTNFFIEQTMEHLPIIQQMTYEERRTTFQDLVNRDPDAMTNEELIDECFLPKMQNLEAFYSGWSTCMSKIDLSSELMTLNQMFCEKNQIEISVEGFLRVITSNQNEKDLALFDFIKTLSKAQLEKLVHFITGKNRLPIKEMGEDLIRILWSERPNQTLPHAQNCTNTLLMPFISLPVTKEKIQNAIQPLFEFDTVYGFL